MLIMNDDRYAYESVMYACVLRGAAVNASAMFCVEILMYNVSLIHAYMYINNACNFLFTHQ